LTVRIEHAEAAGTARTGSPRPPVLSYGVADTKSDAQGAAREGILPPTALRLMD
jgi:hypothetical protein